MRIALFDIDGTLTSVRGAGRGAVERALVDVFGKQIDLDGYSFAGRTDAQIAVDIMARSGQPAEETFAALERLWPIYLEHLARGLAGVTPLVYPGVRELLRRLAADEGWTLGLLTGNHRDAATLKLEASKIDDVFAFGAFGDATVTRNDLGPIALQRAQELLGRPVDPARTVVIGDTPADIACARHAHIAVVAVATGLPSYETLEEAAPDALFADFGETEEVVVALERATGGS